MPHFPVEITILRQSSKENLPMPSLLPALSFERMTLPTSPGFYRLKVVLGKE
ncbi:MAG: hypothetical protein ACJAT3_002253 [Akkermansiaceae bacterium]|jgi:hypothetical protein